MSEVPAIVLVQAVYNYKGKNNDELNFRKGDVITITQKDDGGWWEGTLEGKTGWFPSNYVKDAAAGLADSKQASNPLVVEIVPQQQTFNRNLILKDIIDSEKHHVTDLQSFMKTILSPIANSKILSLEEYNQILRNLPEIIELHSSFVKMLEECHEKPSLEQRVGHIFISMAEKMKVAHSEYCSHHPKAVCILESYKDKLGTFVEGLGGKSPGLVFLTAGLSKPFRRLERYGGYMQELERHMEEFHPDRGDSQRSVFLYQNLATHCAAVRRQKEQELEVLCGSVRSWEGEEPHRLGELIYMGPVKILPSPSNPELKDRHLVLFSQCIVLLSVSQRLSAFVFEKKFPLMGVAVLNPQDETDVSRHSFELVVSGSERMTISCPSREERNKLIDLLQKQLKSPAAAGLTSPTSSSVPYVSRPPFRLLTRYLARLIKTGGLTRTSLAEILDGGKAERQRKLILGCSFFQDDPFSGLISDLSRFRRRCRVECHISTSGGSAPNEEGAPLLILSWNNSGSTSSSYTSKQRNRSRSPSCIRGGSLDAVNHLSPPTAESLFRTQSLPPVDFFFSSPSSEKHDESQLAVQYSSTSAGTWVSHFSFDSGLEDLESGCASPPETPFYRSTLYAHWWRKAKLPSSPISGTL